MLKPIRRDGHGTFCSYHVFIRIENDLPLIIDDIIFNLELVEFLNFIKILKRCCEMTMYPWLSLFKFSIKEHVNQAPHQLLKTSPSMKIALTLLSCLATTLAFNINYEDLERTAQVIPEPELEEGPETLFNPQFNFTGRYYLDTCTIVLTLKVPYSFPLYQVIELSEEPKLAA